MNNQTKATLTYEVVDALYVSDGDGDRITKTKKGDYTFSFSGAAKQDIGPIKKGQFVAVKIKNDTVTFEYNPALFKPQPHPEDDEELDLDTFYNGLTGKYVLTLVPPSLTEKTLD